MTMKAKNSNGTPGRLPLHRSRIVLLLRPGFHGKSFDRLKIFRKPFSILRPRQLFLKIHNLFNLHQKPAVDLREVENLLDGEAGAQGVADEEDAFGGWHARLAADDG